MEMKLKLGIDHAASTVAKYMADDGAPGMTWGAFLRHHGGAVLAEDGEAGARWRGLWSLRLVDEHLKTEFSAHADRKVGAVRRPS